MSIRDGRPSLEALLERMEDGWSIRRDLYEGDMDMGIAPGLRWYLYLGEHCWSASDSLYNLLLSHFAPEYPIEA